MHRRVRFLLVASLTGLASLSAVGCARDHVGASVTESASELKSLTIEQVADKLANKDSKTFVYDSNSKGSWVKGHVPGATWIDIDNVTASDLPADKGALLVFYCYDEA